MKRVAVLGIALSSLGVAHARPVLIEESARFTPPAGVPYEYFGRQVGTNGEWALVLGDRADDSFDVEVFEALLYRRVNGAWVFQRVLAEGSREWGQDTYVYPVLIGMKGNHASVELGDSYSRIFSYNGTDWVETGSASGPMESLSIDGDRILYGVGDSWNGQVMEPNGSGGWTSTILYGQTRCCDDEYWGGPVDILGTRAILGTPYPHEDQEQLIPIYERYPDTGWQILARLRVPTGADWLQGAVALHGDKAIVGGRSGPYVWSNFAGEPSDRLQAVNAYARQTAVFGLKKDGNLVLVIAFDPDFDRNVINVFRPDASGQYRHVAVLKVRQGDLGDFEIYGNTVVASATGGAVSFTLPAEFTAPAPRYETFESGNGANWTPSAGSQFAVVRPTALNGVYRQSSVTGEARSVLGNKSSVHQAIEADIKPTAFDGADRWVGLATRFANAQNYYYVTLRSSGSVQLKRMRAGTFTTLASEPLTVQANRLYRVRLESIGQLHRVRVNGTVVLNVEDPGTATAGNAAVITYKARADFDNVTVSNSPRGSIFADTFADASDPGDWSYSGSGQWSTANGTFNQASLSAEARAIIGTPTEDQIVAVSVRPTAFATASSGQERWAGVMARYTDDRNYYYLTLRNTNALSLRKLVNGAITTIGTVPMPVSLGTSYRLRLEAVGTSLRVYLNNALVIQASDTSHARGRAGPITWKTAAQYDDYIAYQP
jgi:hypothetical protein